jgi:hypothetical protein
VGYVVEVHGASGAFLIRAEPWNSDNALSGLGPWYLPVERLLRRDHSWVIRVRRYFEDPFGPVVYQKRVENKNAVAPAIRHVEALIRGGVFPRPSD